MRNSMSEFEEFVAARQQRLLRVAFLLTRDHHRAEDLLQDAFLKVYRRWRHEGLPEHSEAYIRRVMVTTYISTRRLRRSTEVPVRDEILANEASSSPPTDDRLVVWQALGVLSPRQRTVIVLRVYEGLTDEEIADHLNCATGTVRSLASRAYSTLRTNSALLDRAASVAKD